MSKMRLTAIAEADGCWKFTVSCAAILKPSQLRESFWLVCRMVVVVPDWEMPASPETTCPPTGAACAVADKNNVGRSNAAAKIASSAWRFIASRP